MVLETSQDPYTLANVLTKFLNERGPIIPVASWEEILKRYERSTESNRCILLPLFSSFSASSLLSEKHPYPALLPSGEMGILRYLSHHNLVTLIKRSVRADCLIVAT